MNTITTEQVALFALFISFCSLIVSVLSLHRDRHVVRARAAVVISPNGSPELNISVSNSGKRAISINHILLRPPDHPGMYINFLTPGENRIDVGQSKSCQIHPTGLPVTWKTVQDLQKIDVYVVDAVGKRYKANLNGKKKFWFWLKSLRG
jgi:hypothetical protein